MATFNWTTPGVRNRRKGQREGETLREYLERLRKEEILGSNFPEWDPNSPTGFVRTEAGPSQDYDAMGQFLNQLPLTTDKSWLQKQKDLLKQKFDEGILGQADTVGGGGGLGAAVSTSPVGIIEEGKRIVGDNVVDFGGAFELPSIQDIWSGGGIFNAPSVADITGAASNLLGRNTAVAAPEAAQVPEVLAGQITPEEGPLGPPGTYSSSLEAEQAIKRDEEARKLANAKAGISNLSPELQAALSSGEGVGDAFIRDQQEMQDTLGLVESVIKENPEILNKHPEDSGLLGDDLKAQLEKEYGAEGEFSGVQQPPGEKHVMEDDPGDMFKLKEDGSTVNRSENIEPATRAELERQWGKWTYKPRERREKFMSQLNKIYMKAAWLDAIAALTGGQSRSPQYIERAVGKLETMAKFDQEERVYNIWHDVYYDKDGNYNAPRSKREAAEIARRLGASPAETKAIYGWAEEGEDLQQWWRYDADGNVEVTQVAGKKEEPEQGDGAEWRQGSGPTRPTTTDKVPWVSADGKRQYNLTQGVTPESIGMGPGWTIGVKEGAEGNVPGGKPVIVFIENVYARNGYGEAGKAAAVEALVARMRVDPGIYGIIGEFKDEAHRASAVRIVDNWIREYEARGRKSYSSQGAALDAADTTTAPTPTETREEYEARVRKKHPNASEEDIQATVAKKYG